MQIKDDFSKVLPFCHVKRLPDCDCDICQCSDELMSEDDLLGDDDVSWEQ